MIHKPTFTNQLLGLPRAEVPHILEKVELLRDAPQPDAKNKKRLQHYKGSVYRIRAGNYRIIYTFGDGWVALLGVDNRKDVYEGDQLLAEGPGFNVAGLPEFEELLAPAPTPEANRSPRKQTRSAENDLPGKINNELLERLRVPEEWGPALVSCKSIDDLLAANVPDVIRDRVFDVVTSADYDRVLQQPSFATGDVGDLLRFVEGELVDFLLKLDREQEKFVDWALNGSGPTLVKGGPGTGKSTVALYRARSILNALRASGNEQPHVLFTTYTNALVASSRQLLRRLLGSDADLVTVQTADSLAIEIVASVDDKPHLIDAGGLRTCIKEALDTAVFDGNALERRAQVRTIERLTPDYLVEEIGSVIHARDLTTLDDYLAASRAGRQVPLNATQRTAVWRVHQAFERALTRRGQLTWQQLRQRAAQIVRGDVWTTRYDAVIVDEAQDLDATVLRMLVDLCRTPDRLFVTADANQSIYGSSFRWKDVHSDLRFQGRTGILRQNYRSTQEIDRAASSYLQSAELDDEFPPTTYVQTGPVPAVRAVISAYDETQLLLRFLGGAARELRLGIGACAVLVPTETVGRAIAGRLRDGGLDAEFMPGRELNLERHAVKVLTLKSAKGLEFPIVTLAGFVDGYVPHAPRNASAEETDETLLRDRRTMYVAMTRAMRALLVVTPAEHASLLFTGFDDTLWNTHGGAVQR